MEQETKICKDCKFYRHKFRKCTYHYFFHKNPHETCIDWIAKIKAIKRIYTHKINTERFKIYGDNLLYIKDVAEKLNISYERASALFWHGGLKKYVINIKRVKANKKAIRENDFKIFIENKKKELSGLIDIEKLPKTYIDNNVAGVYFLYDENDELQYIGSSNNIISRIGAHLRNGINGKGWIPTKYSYIKYNVENIEELRSIEYSYIMKYKPPINDRRVNLYNKICGRYSVS